MFGSRHRWLGSMAAGIGGLLLLPASGLGARMAAELQRDTIYFGTQTLLVVELVDAATTAWPVVEPVKGLQITRYGGPRSVRDLFGGTVRRTYRFLVSPEKPGTFQIPSVSLATTGSTLERGPFALRVIEAPLQFRSAQIEPAEIRVGETAKLTVSYQGVRPGKAPEVPAVDGLTIRKTGKPRVEVSRQTGKPITTYTFEVRASQLGTCKIKGISLDGVAAKTVILTVSPFVVVGVQVGETSLVVGGQTTVHVVVRGLPHSAGLKLVAPAGLKVVPSRQRYRGRTGATVFSFDVTPTEPGILTVTTLALPDGRKIRLEKPISLSVRQSGEGGILACRGIPRREETVLGEPFFVDYELFFRGDLRGAGIDLSEAAFANKPHIRIEPVNDLSTPDWPHQSIQATFGQSRAIMRVGNGEFNGQKEQLLRFTLKITPLAAGELSLDGLQVVLLLQIKRDQRTGTSFFSAPMKSVIFWLFTMLSPRTGFTGQDSSAW